MSWRPLTETTATTLNQLTPTDRKDGHFNYNDTIEKRIYSIHDYIAIKPVTTQQYNH